MRQKESRVTYLTPSGNKFKEIKDRYPGLSGFLNEHNSSTLNPNSNRDHYVANPKYQNLLQEFDSGHRAQTMPDEYEDYEHLNRYNKQDLPFSELLKREINISLRENANKSERKEIDFSKLKINKIGSYVAKKIEFSGNKFAERKKLNQQTTSAKLIAEKIQITTKDYYRTFFTNIWIVIQARNIKKYEDEKNLLKDSIPQIYGSDGTIFMDHPRKESVSKLLIPEKKATSKSESIFSISEPQKFDYPKKIDDSLHEAKGTNHIIETYASPAPKKHLEYYSNPPMLVNESTLKNYEDYFLEQYDLPKQASFLPIESYEAVHHVKPPLRRNTATSLFKDGEMKLKVDSTKNDISDGFLSNRSVKTNQKEVQTEFPLEKAHDISMISTTSARGSTKNFNSKINFPLNQDILDHSNITDNSFFFKSKPPVSFIRSNEISRIDERSTFENSNSLANKIKSIPTELFDSSKPDKDNSRIQQRQQRLEKIYETLNKNKSISVNNLGPEAQKSPPKQLKTEPDLSEENDDFFRKSSKPPKIVRQSLALPTIDDQIKSPINSDKRLANTPRSMTQKIHCLHRMVENFGNSAVYNIESAFKIIKEYDPNLELTRSKYRFLRTSPDQNTAFVSFSNQMPITAFQSGGITRIQIDDSPNFSAKKKDMTLQGDSLSLSPNSVNPGSVLLAENILMAFVRKSYRYGIDALKQYLDNNLESLESQSFSLASTKKNSIEKMSIPRYRMQDDDNIYGSLDQNFIPQTVEKTQGSNKYQTPKMNLANAFDQTKLDETNLTNLIFVNQNTPKRGNNLKGRFDNSQFSPENKNAQIKVFEENDSLISDKTSFGVSAILGNSQMPNEVEETPLNAKNILGSSVLVTDARKKIIEINSNRECTPEMLIFYVLDKNVISKTRDLIWDAFYRLKGYPILDMKTSPVPKTRHQRKMANPLTPSITRPKQDESVHRRLLFTGDKNDNQEVNQDRTRIQVKSMLSFYLVLDKIIKGAKKSAFRELKMEDELSGKQINEYGTIISVDLIKKSFLFTNLIERIMHKSVRFAFKKIVRSDDKEDKVKKLLQFKVFENKINELRMRRKRTVFGFIRDSVLQETRIKSIQSIQKKARNTISIQSGLDKLRLKLSKMTKKILYYSFKKIKNSKKQSRELVLYTVGLLDVLKQLKKSRLKYALIKIKKMSQFNQTKRLERGRFINRLLGYKILKEQVLQKKFLRRWKSISDDIRKEFVRSSSARKSTKLGVDESKVKKLITTIKIFQFINISKAFKALHLHLIDRKNLEKGYLNLALKLIYIFKTNREINREYAFQRIRELNDTRPVKEIFETPVPISKKRALILTPSKLNSEAKTIIRMQEILEALIKTNMDEAYEKLVHHKKDVVAVLNRSQSLKKSKSKEINFQNIPVAKFNLSNQ